MVRIFITSRIRIRCICAALQGLVLRVETLTSLDDNMHYNWAYNVGMPTPLFQPGRYSQYRAIITSRLSVTWTVFKAKASNKLFLVTSAG